MTTSFDFVKGVDEPAAGKWAYVMFEGVYVPRVGCTSCGRVIRLGKDSPNYVETFKGAVTGEVVCVSADFKDTVLLNDWGNWP